jgi:hypothetical protein
MGQAEAQIAAYGRSVVYQTAKPLSGTMQHGKALIKGWRQTRPTTKVPPYSTSKCGLLPAAKVAKTENQTEPNQQLI